MKPELNREYPELDDSRVFEEMVDLTVNTMKPNDGRLLRAQHAKTTGCVEAEFRIADDVPADLRHGVFRTPGQKFRAIVRFSNRQGPNQKDSEGQARGLAIKLLNVVGPRAVKDDQDTSQDFLMVNHPSFPFANPKEYLKTMKHKEFPLVGDAAAVLLMDPKERKIAGIIRGKEVTNPLETRYWSGSPYWLGDPVDVDEGHAVKYSAVPHQVDRTAPPELPNDPPDYLVEAMDRHLQAHEAVFDFKVQLQIDPIAMPVEDVSVEWDETRSKPLTVAILRIPPQKVDRSGVTCESLSFSPWHALAQHRPMGGMNRLRRAVYLASFSKRSAE
jgi:hypothetical protein